LIANNNCGADTTTSEVTIIEVGIEELANTNNVSLVPNPANEFTQVVFNQKATAVTSIDVLDITGKSVMNAFNGQLVAGQNNIAVNTSTLAPGVYLVRIASEGISLTYRLAVSK
jgi:hypothetical protein